MNLKVLEEWMFTELFLCIAHWKFGLATIKNMLKLLHTIEVIIGHVLRFCKVMFSLSPFVGDSFDICFNIAFKI